jgi:hypothetical protein
MVGALHPWWLAAMRLAGVAGASGGCDCGLWLRAGAMRACPQARRYATIFSGVESRLLPLRLVFIGCSNDVSAGICSPSEPLLAANMKHSLSQSTLMEYYHYLSLTARPADRLPPLPTWGTATE